MTAIAIPPAVYSEWRNDPNDRAEDAAYTFGHHLIVHCRDDAMARIPADASRETKALVEESVDLARHNVMDLLEGFWDLPSGDAHSVEYVLQVRVRDASGTEVESIAISPAKLDLPIGYWKWAKDREFR
jgi:hypothetical protein